MRSFLNLVAVVFVAACALSAVSHANPLDQIQGDKAKLRFIREHVELRGDAASKFIDECDLLKYLDTSTAVTNYSADFMRAEVLKVLTEMRPTQFVHQHRIAVAKVLYYFLSPAELPEEAAKFPIFSRYLDAAMRSDVKRGIVLDLPIQHIMTKTLFHWFTGVTEVKPFPVDKLEAALSEMLLEMFMSGDAEKVYQTELEGYIRILANPAPSTFIQAVGEIAKSSPRFLAALTRIHRKNPEGNKREVIFAILNYAQTQTPEIVEDANLKTEVNMLLKNQHTGRFQRVQEEALPMPKSSRPFKTIDKCDTWIFKVKEDLPRK